MFFLSKSAFNYFARRVDQKLLEHEHRIEALEVRSRETRARPVMHREDLTRMGSTVIQIMEAKIKRLEGIMAAHKIKDRRVNRALKPARRSGIERRGL